MTITASSYALANVTFTVTALASNSPSISAGGIASAGLSTPPVECAVAECDRDHLWQRISLQPERRKQAGLVNGQLPTNLAGVCVEFATVRAPIFAVYPSQINVQVPAVTPGNVPVQVITDCDTPQAVASPPVSVAAQATAPEFFYFTHNSSGANPIAAINAVTGGYIGAPGLIGGATFTPAKPGDYLTLFATGFGATNPAFAPGVLPSGDAQSDRAGLHHVRWRDLDPIARSCTWAFHNSPGLYQVNIQVPAGVPDWESAAGDHGGRGGVACERIHYGAEAVSYSSRRISSGF